MSTGGSRDQQVGWHYFGNFARALCVGPVDVVHRITMGETVIFEGPVDRDSADAAGKTVLDTSLGPIRFYWGATDQLPDDYLEQFFELVAGMPGVCYYVAEDISWGENNPNPPNLSFEVERRLESLPLAQHENEGDVSPAEALYAFLVDDYAGPGIDPERIDASSFVAAANALAEEGIWCTPELDDHHALREIVAQFNLLAGGRLVRRNGLIAYLLDRPAEPVLVVGPSLLLEEPAERDSAEPVSETFLAYRDRKNKDEEAVEGYTDIATQEAVADDPEGDQIEMHWVRRREVARRLVSRLGLVASRGRREWSLSVLPRETDLAPGERIRVDYPRWGWSGRVMVVEEIDRRLERWDLRLAEDTAVDTATLAAIDPPEVEFEEFEAALTLPVIRIAHRPAIWAGDALGGIMIMSNRQVNSLVSLKTYHRRVEPLNIVIMRHKRTFLTFSACVSVAAAKQVPPEWTEKAFEETAVEGGDVEDLGIELEKVWSFRVQGNNLSDRLRLADLLSEDQADEVFLVGFRVVDGTVRADCMVCAVSVRVVAVDPAAGVWEIAAVTGIDGDGPEFRESGPEIDAVTMLDVAFVGRREDFQVWDMAGSYNLRDRHEFRAKSRRDVVISQQDHIAWSSGGERWYLNRPADDPIGTEGDPVTTLYPLLDEELGKEFDSGAEPDPAIVAGADEALGALFEGSEELDDIFYADADRALGAFMKTGFYDPLPDEE